MNLCNISRFHIQSRFCIITSLHYWKNSSFNGFFQNQKQCVLWHIKYSQSPLTHQFSAFQQQQWNRRLMPHTAAIISSTTGPNHINTLRYVGNILKLPSVPGFFSSSLFLEYPGSSILIFESVATSTRFSGCKIWKTVRAVVLEKGHNPIIILSTIHLCTVK